MGSFIFLLTDQHKKQHNFYKLLKASCFSEVKFQDKHVKFMLACT